LFVVPTISFRLLYGLLIMGHGRRHILWFGVTAHPTAEWIANQITQACGREQAPRHLIRDRDGAYGEVFIRRLRSIGIRDRPTPSRSPWQNGYAERLMLSGNPADFYRQAPWMILFPGVAISIAVFAFNLFGDSLRDYLDPRFKV
jgi:hypothetical protein